MNILFLDDDPCRHKTFQQIMIGKGSITFVKTAVECIKQLEGKTWDWVFLDHDLGGETFVGSDREDCGMEVVRWITEHKPEIPKIIAHTANTGAGLAMQQVLLRSGYDAKFVTFWRLEPFLNTEFGAAPTCCGGNDEYGKDYCHTMDCSEYPGQPIGNEVPPENF